MMSHSYYLPLLNKKGVTHTFTYKNSTYAKGDPNTVTTSNLNTTDTNLIVAHVGWYYAAGTPTFSDSLGNTWVALPIFVNPGLVTGSRFYYCVNPTIGATHTFTVALTGGYPQVTITTYLSTGNSPSYKESDGNGTDATSLNLGSYNFTATNNLVVIGANFLDPDLPITVNNGFTITSSWDYAAGANFGGMGGYKIKADNSTESNITISHPQGTFQSGNVAVFNP